MGEMDAALTVHLLLQYVFELFKFCPFCLLHRSSPPAGSSPCPWCCSYQEKQNGYCSLKKLSASLNGLVLLKGISLADCITLLFIQPSMAFLSHFVRQRVQDATHTYIWKCRCERCSLSPANGTHSAPGAPLYCQCPNPYHA